MQTNDNTPPLELLQRLVEDREALSDVELEQLVAVLRTEPELVKLLRDQLRCDELLSQQLTLDRTHFAAQVNQRIDDFLVGEKELNLQAETLRRMALSHWHEPLVPVHSTSRASYFAWGAAVVAIAVVVLGVGFWQVRESASRLVQITAVSGRAVIKRPQTSDQYALANSSLQPGDRLVVQHDASLDLNYPDGTTLHVNGGSVINFPKGNQSGKTLYVDRGAVAASIRPQPVGKPMLFQTPHAEAIVRGTELYLQVREEETELEVAEGKVEFVERKQGDTQFIVGGEAAVAATAQKITKSQLRWPTSQEGLVYVFAGGKRHPLVREGKLMLPTSLISQHAQATYNAQGQLEFQGGSFIDTTGATLLANNLQQQSTFTLEIVFASETQSEHPLTTLFALSGEHTLQGALVQQNKHCYWVAQESLTPLSSLPQKHVWELGEITSTGLQHWVLSFDKATLHVAKNGKLQRTIPYSHSWMSDPITRITLGSSTEQKWQGRIAAFALYARPFTPQELQRTTNMQ